MNLKQIIATNVRNQRTVKKMTQAQLAEELDLSTHAVGKIERELLAPSFKTLEKLCQVFRVDIAELFGASVSIDYGNERARDLNEINSIISQLSDKELKQVIRLLKALK